MVNSFCLQISFLYLSLFFVCGTGAAIAVPDALREKFINSSKETIVVITLKKSFEFQNYLKSLFDAALSVLSFNDNITETKQEHMRKKVLADAEDEVVTKPKRHEYEFDMNTLIDFVCYIQEQMATLTTEIDKMMLETSVYYVSIFEIGDDLEEAVTKYLDEKNKGNNT